MYADTVVIFFKFVWCVKFIDVDVMITIHHDDIVSGKDVSN